MTQHLNTFQKHGHTWITHKPGDPMPVEGSTKVLVLLDKNDFQTTAPMKAKNLPWVETRYGSVVGWRYAEQKPTAP